MNETAISIMAATHPMVEAIKEVCIKIGSLFLLMYICFC